MDVIFRNTHHDYIDIISSFVKASVIPDALCFKEYDTVQASQWVPFPLNYAGLNHLFRTIGYAKRAQINDCAAVIEVVYMLL